MALVLPLELHLVFHVFDPLHPARDFDGFLHDEYGAYCARQPDHAFVGFDANPFVPDRRFSGKCRFHPAVMALSTFSSVSAVFVSPVSLCANISCPVIVEQLGSPAIRMAKKSGIRL